MKNCQLRKEMLCEECYQHQATVHLTLINGQSKGERHLCNVCCPLGKSEKEDQETISQFLQGLPLDSPRTLPPIISELNIPSPITVIQLASLLNQKPSQVVAELMDLGIFASLNHELDFNTSARLARQHGFTARPAA